MPNDVAAEETVAVKAFGMELNATGQNLIWLVLALSVVGGFAYFLYMHHSATQEADNRILEKLNEMVFVMSLPQDKRDRLEIEMPDSLRSKLRRKQKDE
jgi:preprotein translocase subunit YajC